MNRFVIRQSLLLLLTATIWGVAFVSQSVGMDYVGPFTFNAVRSLIGAAVLIPCIAVLKKLQKKDETQEIGFYHGHVYHSGSGFRYFSEKESGTADGCQRGDRCGGAISAVYDGKFAV